MHALPVHQIILHVRGLSVHADALRQQKSKKERARTLALAGECVDRLLEICQALRVHHSVAELQILQATIRSPHTKRNLDLLLMDQVNSVCKSLVLDMQTPLFLYVDGLRAQFYTNETPFGPNVEAHFPNARREATEASKCIATARHTASVFHSMRVMEIGLKAISRALSIPPVTKAAKRNWHFMLKDINDAIDKSALDAKNRGTPWKEEPFFRSMAADLMTVKGAWRNETMHVARTPYTEDEAINILFVTKRFMEDLSSRFDEKGRPVKAL